MNRLIVRITSPSDKGDMTGFNEPKLGGAANRDEGTISSIRACNRIHDCASAVTGLYSGTAGGYQGTNFKREVVEPPKFQWFKRSSAPTILSVGGPREW